MNKREVEQYARELIHSLISEWRGSHEAERWQFRWNKNYGSLGRCFFGKNLIELSERWIETLPFSEIDDTIRHEIAHALAGARAGHGPKWMMWARRVGAKPQRLLNEESSKNHAPTPKYVMLSPEGKVMKRYYRRPNALTIANIKNSWVRGRKGETKGKLKIVPYSKNNLVTQRCISEETQIRSNGPKYVIVDPQNKVVKTYWRRPSKKVYQNLPTLYVSGRKAETIGRLKIVPYRLYRPSHEIF